MEGVVVVASAPDGRGGEDDGQALLEAPAGGRAITRHVMCMSRGVTDASRGVSAGRSSFAEPPTDSSTGFQRLLVF